MRDTEPAEFWEIYVEGIAGGRRVCYDGSGYFFAEGPGASCEKLYGLIPYEEVINYVDLEGQRLLREVLLLPSQQPSRGSKGYLFPPGTPLCLQEIQGKNVYTLAREGSEVKRGERLAYVITGKMEVRNVFSLCEGFIIACVDIVWERPERVVLVISRERPREVFIG